MNTIEPLKRGRKILFIGHSDIFQANGGVEYHLRHLISVLKKDNLVSYLYGTAQGFSITHFEGNRKKQINLKFHWKNRNGIKDPNAEKYLRHFIKFHNFDVVHFHHLMGLCWSLIDVSQKLTKTLVTLHDYYALCSRYDLLDRNGNFCGFDFKLASCDHIGQDEHYPKPLERHKKRASAIRKILNKVEIIIPSNLAAYNFKKYGKLRLKKLSILPIPLDTIPLNYRPNFTGTLRIAFIGNFNKKKGAEYFYRIVQTCYMRKLPVSWHVIGQVDNYGLYEILRAKYGVNFYGAYNSADLSSILKAKKISIGMILSNWPETYSLTLSELMAMNIPSIVTEIGAHFERVVTTGFGWTVSIDEIENQCYELLKQVVNNRNMLTEKKISFSENNEQDLNKYLDVLL